ncbi:hypothetical protein D5F01_LYC10522 [Larimichthys crocea]|uniref:C2H2-type domain-containing protein n=1 Tax=Larimichthys crocea TaxID=215358 RepID=A0A6G0IHM1_LARCR|nr:hypothetical protein D5F01_LYC10522 [Larimichthys crocea]
MTPGTVQLKPCVVPSLCIKSEQDEPLESPQYVEPVETICKREDSNTCNSPTDSEESKHILTGSQPSLQSSGVVLVSCVSNAVASGSHQTQEKVTIDLNKEKAALLQMKGKFVVNESCLLQLFCRKCPSCGGKLQLEKVTYGLLIILNQQCLQCDYRYQWKSQVNASVPTEEDQTQQEIPTDDNPRRTVFSETVTFSDEESDPSDDGEEGDEVTFKARVDKLKHEQIHQNNKDPYKCPDCPETFPTSKERNTHLSNHRAPKEFKCGVCGIEFKDVHHLRRHSVVHTGLKPYKCSVCKRGFNQSNHLKSHMRLHTGERPYKCQHCDRSFNHNVSLKSHVLRYHSSSSGPKQKKKKIKEITSDSGDTVDNGNKEGRNSEFDNVGEEHNTQEEAQKEKKETPKIRKRSTGRPRGRPKRNAAGDTDLAGQRKGPRSKTKTGKSKVQKLKKTSSSDEESEDEQSDSDISFDSAEQEEEEEEVEEKETARKSTGRSRGRPKNDSDTDFDPEEETKKKRYSTQSSGKSAVKRQGRPKKNLAV